MYAAKLQYTHQSVRVGIHKHEATSRYPHLLLWLWSLRVSPRQRYRLHALARSSVAATVVRFPQLDTLYCYMILHAHSHSLPHTRHTPTHSHHDRTHSCSHSNTRSHPDRTHSCSHSYVHYISMTYSYTHTHRHTTVTHPATRPAVITAQLASVASVVALPVGSMTPSWTPEKAGLEAVLCVATSTSWRRALK